jgi:hypothetical protein
MTKEQFNEFWTSKYSETVPISHYFKDDYNNKWFRIHSLPESKRFANTDEEWTILLTRQNQIITDLLGQNTNILIVTGEYNWGERQTFITEEEEVFKPYVFKRLDNIDLFELTPDDYDKGEIYRPAFAETIWVQNKHDKLLREISVDKVRAFFISIEKNVLIAPYDGGVDFILKDSETRNTYKLKYKDWLSKREDDY